MAESVDIAEFAFAVEDLLGPSTGKTKRLGECTEQLDDLGYVIVVFPVPGAGLGVEQVIAGY